MSHPLLLSCVSAICGTPVSILQTYPTELGVTDRTSLCTQVIAVGSGKANEKGEVVRPTVSKGDTVLYQKYSGVDFEGDNDQQYVVLKDSDILAALS